MKCLGIHLGSIEMSTQPVTPAKQRLRWNKTAHNNRHVAGLNKVFHHSNKGFESHSKCGIKRLHRCFLSPPRLLPPDPCGSLALSLPSLPGFDGLTCFQAEDKNNSHIYSSRTWCCVCVCSMKGRAGVQSTARDNFTGIKGRWRFHTEGTFLERAMLAG